ncbi:MAG: sigma-54-dependent transcriptional regulator [Planctomycetota bacterium]
MSSRARILVVEPEAGVLSWVTDNLSVEGYDVVSARDGDTALRNFRSEKLDLIVAEIFLPGLNGVELLRRVKQETNDVEVILTARDAPVQTVVNAMKDGAFDYLEKPIDSDRLRIAVGKALSRAQLERENAALKRISQSGAHKAPELISSSAAMAEVLNTIDLVAPTDLTVLIEGESGVGKELVATRVHKLSPRSNSPMIAINCGVMHENLLESELFGHKKGSFTGAINDHQGIFEVADKGTLFLDEIGEMSVDLQVKLLRVLENSEFRRVGGHKTIRVDVRIIAATNRKLKEEVAKGTFREDLFYRLNVIKLDVPPLRHRTEEIPDLVGTFIERARHRGLRSRKFGKDAIEAMQAYHWPGNVRELENLIERTLILAPHDTVRAVDLPAFLSASPPSSSHSDGGGGGGGFEDVDLPLAEIEKRHIIRALSRNQCNKVRTAKKLGINVKTLYNKIKGYNIDVDQLKVSGSA